MAEPLSILGIPIDPLDTEQVLGRVSELIRGGQQGMVATVNPEMALYASRHLDFVEILRGAAIRTPDGVGILWAARYLSRPAPRNPVLRGLAWFASLIRLPFSKPNSIHLRERVTGTDLMARIADRSRTENWSLYLLGAEPCVAEAAAAALGQRYPGCRIVGWHSGSPSPADEAEIADRINQAQPTILFVAFGSPAQERWIQRCLPRLSSVRVALGVGGAFDFYAGKRKRAPTLLQKIGLEWLWRLLIQPSRLKRIWNATIVFPWTVFRDNKEH